MITHGIEKSGMLPNHKRVQLVLWRKILKIIKSSKKTWVVTISI